MSTNPNTVKSQHELTNESGRKSDVLVEAISKLETTTKENELLKEIIKDEMIKNGEILEEIERLQKQLDIAVKALRGVRVWANTGNGGEQAVKKLCNEALKEIKELNK